jgi:hypothetical protein
MCIFSLTSICFQTFPIRLTMFPRRLDLISANHSLLNLTASAIVSDLHIASMPCLESVTSPLMSTFLHSRTCGSALCGATSRSFSDEHVACIRLQDIDESPLLNEYYPETVTWKLGGTPCNEYCTASGKVVHLI